MATAQRAVRARKMTANRASAGDRLRVTCTDVDGVDVDATVTALRVDRLSCGCDRIRTIRPGCPVTVSSASAFGMELLPVGCYHPDPVDFDAARAAAGTEAVVTS